MPAGMAKWTASMMLCDGALDVIRGCANSVPYFISDKGESGGHSFSPTAPNKWANLRGSADYRKEPREALSRLNQF
jgi:hypothetical protein